MLNSIQPEFLKAGCLEAEDNSMLSITLQTRTGPEEYQVADLDEVVWWKTENGIKAVGYMDVVSGQMSENDLDTCQLKRPEIVREILAH
ncbi:MAG TPA: hypothetical protein VKB46_24750 [Pyrinomonadaceae bacterium]|nr:hypothetical protein [Pyrinomonadaceae bacterium]